jgi:hypothetical protein
MAFAVLAVSLLLASTAGASPREEFAAAPDAPAVGPVEPTISYQGQLTDASGNPLSGSYDLTFQFWDDATGGAQIGSDISRAAVAVEDGLFTADLAVPPVALDGRALWLRIAVEGAWLSPRQPLLGVPYAHTLRPGARITGDGAEPFRTLTVVNNGLGAALGVQGASVGLSAAGMTGIKAEGDLGVLGTGMVGVRGMGDPGTGVEGISEAGIGVRGLSNAMSGKGVVGTADDYGGVGVEGNAGFGTGVAGAGEIGVKGTGSVGPGVQAEGAVGVMANGLYGDGVSAETAGEEPAAAVRGSAGTDAYGGHFSSEGGIGIYGIGQEGVHGQSTDAKYPGVHGVGPGPGVRGESIDAAGVLGQSEDGVGVVAVSSNGIGLSANAGTTPIVALLDTIGVVASGEDQGINAWGGQTGGQFSGSVGVSATGNAASGEGVHGHGTGTLAEGVLGTSATATGVYGIASGTGANAIGVWGQTAGTFGLYTAQKVYAGNGCVGCAVAQLAENVGDEPLEVGDVVAIVGLAPPLPGHPTPRLGVRRAVAGDAGLRGVVQSRMTVATRPAPTSGDPDESATVDIPAAAPGPVRPGDGLVVVLEGLAQVRVSADAGAIDVGDELVAGDSEFQVRRAPVRSAAVSLGYALEPLPAGRGLVWALVQQK